MPKSIMPVPNVMMKGEIAIRKGATGGVENATGTIEMPIPATIEIQII